MAIEELWLLPWIPERGRVAVDVGANHGDWSRLLVERFDRVYAVEPNPSLYGLHAPNVVMIAYGAWNRQTVRSFAVYADDKHLSTHFFAGGINTGNPVAEVRLACLPLDDMIIEGPVDFIKIDVEGAEREVVEGARQMIACHRPRLIIEMHTTGVRGPLQKILVRWGYNDFTIVPHPLYEAGSELWHAHRWLICDAP